RLATRRKGVGSRFRTNNVAERIAAPDPARGWAFRGSSLTERAGQVSGSFGPGGATSMARRSVYEFEAKGVVSIGVATVGRTRLPDACCAEPHAREEDEPSSRFSEDFGFGYNDHDVVDTNWVTDRPKPLERLLGECSFSASYLADAVAAAKRQGFDQTEF